MNKLTPCWKYKYIIEVYKSKTESKKELRKTPLTPPPTPFNVRQGYYILYENC